MNKREVCCINSACKDRANWIVGIITLPIWGLFFLPHSINGNFDIVHNLAEFLLWTSITSILVGSLKEENTRKCLAFAGALGVFVALILSMTLKIFITNEIAAYTVLPVGIFCLLHQLKMVMCWSLDCHKKKKG